MKTHYSEIKDWPAICNSHSQKHVTEDHKKVTCINCIKLMSEDERAWHDWNNKEWIAFVERADGWTMGR